MSYATLADLQALISDEELIQLTDDQGLAIDEVQVAAAIARADERIDGYLANLATVPLLPVPPLVVQYSAKLALTELYLRRSSAGLSESWSRERSEILKHLADLAHGRARLVGLAAQPGETKSPAGALAASPSAESYPLSRLGEY